MDPSQSSPNSEETLLKAKGRILSTMEEDGSRRWLKPRLSSGKWLSRRRWVAYFLIVVFTALPFVHWQGRPFIKLDLLEREFTIGFVQFLATDTLLLALFLVAFLLTIVFMTALTGRVWCGWACPQTVYMEFVFRPIERLFDGTIGRGGKSRKPKAQGWRIAAKYLVYLVICIYLSHTFLAYFVGVDTLAAWIWTMKPWEHPFGIGVVALVTVAMMFDFCFFREQLCIIACPYGRFQSVLLDRHSLIVAYDEKRGEPRGKAKKRASSQGAETSKQGDCVDCELCVTTCPTGIDIRQGLQLECINCTQCIDACNKVMVQLGRSPDLIRYSSQASDEGKPRTWLRPRVVIYPLILAVVATALIVLVTTRVSFEASALRLRGNPYRVTEQGLIENTFDLKLTNRSEDRNEIEIKSVEPSIVNARLHLQSDTSQAMPVEPQASASVPLVVTVPKEQWEGRPIDVRIRLVGSQGDELTVPCTLQGPP